MNNTELADLIEERFTPFAFTCDCNGAMYECQDAKEDPKMWAQYDTVIRITKYIRGLA
jgi:hypothetical protein